MMLWYLFAVHMCADIRPMMCRQMRATQRREAGVGGEHAHATTTEADPPRSGSPAIDPSAFQPLVEALKESEESIQANRSFAALCEVQRQQIELNNQAQLSAQLEKEMEKIGELAHHATAWHRGLLKAALQKANTLHAQLKIEPMDIDGMLASLPPIN